MQSSLPIYTSFKENILFILNHHQQKSRFNSLCNSDLSCLDSESIKQTIRQLSCTKITPLVFSTEDTVVFIRLWPRICNWANIRVEFVNIKWWWPFNVLLFLIIWFVAPWAKELDVNLLYWELTKRLTRYSESVEIATALMVEQWPMWLLSVPFRPPGNLASFSPVLKSHMTSPASLEPETMYLPSQLTVKQVRVCLWQLWSRRIRIELKNDLNLLYLMIEQNTNF